MLITLIPQRSNRSSFWIRSSLRVTGLLLLVWGLAGLLPATVHAQAPAPANLTVYSGAAQAHLSWPASAGASSYNVQRATTSGGPYALIANTSATSYTDNSVTTGVQYYYVVSALSGGVAGANSPQGSAIPVVAGGSYSIINRLSGLALSAGAFNFTIQKAYTNNNELWQFSSLGNGLFSFVNVGNGLALSGPTTFTQLTTGAYTGATNQQWYLQVTNGSSYVIRNAATGQVLDNFGNSMTGGTAVGQWSPTGGSNQEWTLGPKVSALTLTGAAPRAEYTFSGTVNTSNMDTTITCRLGDSTSFSANATQVIPASSTPASFTITVTLSVDRATTLHGQVTAQNASGTSTSSGLSVNSPVFEMVMSAALGNFGPTRLMTDSLRWVDSNDDGYLDLATMGGKTTGYLETASGFVYNPMLNSTAFGYPGPGQNFWYMGFATSSFSGGRDGVLLPSDFNGDNVPDMLWAGSYENQIATMGSKRPIITYGQSGSTPLLLARAIQIFTLPEEAWYPNYPRAIVGDLDHSGVPQFLLSSGLKNLDGGLPTQPGTQLIYRRSGITNGAATFRTFNTLKFLDDSNSNDVNTLLVGTSYAMAGGFLSKNGFKDLYVYNSPDNFTSQATVYRNDGEGSYTPVASWAGLGNAFDSPVLDPSTQRGGANAVWADFNGDGFDDLLTVENSLKSSRMRILLNDGTGNFTNSNWVLPPNYFKASIAVADIFNQGRNDIVLTGGGSGFDNAVVFPPLVLRNDGNGVFTPIDYKFPAILNPGGDGGVVLGDYDKDGRLDIAMAGTPNNLNAYPTVQDYSPAVYRNTLNIPANTPPTAPTGLGSTVSAGRVDLRWGDATDAITPVNSLTYNVRIGTTPQGTDIVSPLSNVTTGWRKVAERGNLGHCLGTWWKLPPGTYYWSVQAVDGGLAGGPWAPEQSFTITSNDMPVVGFNGSNITSIVWPARFEGWTGQQSSDLKTWTTSNAITVGSVNGKWLMTFPATSSPAQFYRLQK